MLKLFLLTALLLGIGMAGLAIKIWAKKDGQFDGTCASKNVKLKAQGVDCGCGKTGVCQNEGKDDHDHDHGHYHHDEPVQKVFVKSMNR